MKKGSDRCARCGLLIASDATGECFVFSEETVMTVNGHAMEPSRDVCKHCGAAYLEILQSTKECVPALPAVIAANSAPKTAGKSISDVVKAKIESLQLKRPKSPQITIDPGRPGLFFLNVLGLGQTPAAYQIMGLLNARRDRTKVVSVGPAVWDDVLRTPPPPPETGTFFQFRIMSDQGAVPVLVDSHLPPNAVRLEPQPELPAKGRPSASWTSGL
jgi:hypothetical protein